MKNAIKKSKINKTELARKTCKFKVKMNSQEILVSSQNKKPRKDANQRLFFYPNSH